MTCNSVLARQLTAAAVGNKQNGAMTYRLRYMHVQTGSGGHLGHFDEQYVSSGYELVVNTYKSDEQHFTVTLRASALSGTTPVELEAKRGRCLIFRDIRLTNTVALHKLPGRSRPGIECVHPPMRAVICQYLICAEGAGNCDLACPCDLEGALNKG